VIGENKILAVIPARGGSKGLPRKNLLPLGGKPLIAWTVQAAQSSRYIDRTVFSSEDEELIRTAREWGCEVPFPRPTELANDTSRNIDVVLHLLEQLPGYDILALLQPTSPLRTAQHIDQAIELMHRQGAGSCISVSVASKSPYWSYTMAQSGRLMPLVDASMAQQKRQLQPETYHPNGAIYLISIPLLKETGRFIQPDTLGYTMSKASSIDIDDAIDFKLAELLLGDAQ
jgi:CMP-N,N'-diacetyllegionaminic acid synthase